ncbi:MAG: TIGR02757 family protein, partial [Lentisphaerae bacterium]|nr:TIGR02757 family protein [Lentisphaerota bacterium]
MNKIKYKFTDVFIAEEFERIYSVYHSRVFLGTDPILFLYEYSDPLDREIVALLASSLAYGRVTQIITSINRLLLPMGDSPADFIKSTKPSKLTDLYKDFRHRFTGPEDIAQLLTGIRKLLRKYGSLNECFIAGYNENDDTILPGLISFVEEIFPEINYLLPNPERGSACKRLNLFLRWMVRKDEIDPGGWFGVSPAKLISPLDAHMF